MHVFVKLLSHNFIYLFNQNVCEQHLPLNRILQLAYVVFDYNINAEILAVHLIWQFDDRAGDCQT